LNSPSPDELVAALQVLANTRELRRQAEEGCRECLRSCAEDNDLEGWSLDEIELHFRSCALVFDHQRMGCPYFETRIELAVQDPNVLVINDLPRIGYYLQITRLDGTYEDEYFVLDTAK
jgi:hypothetical protein